jgi:hypothetical protein
LAISNLFPPFCPSLPLPARHIFREAMWAAFLLFNSFSFLSHLSAERIFAIISS